jgi:hypothetical protein
VPTAYSSPCTSFATKYEPGGSHVGFKNKGITRMSRTRRARAPWPQAVARRTVVTLAGLRTRVGRAPPWTGKDADQAWLCVAAYDAGGISTDCRSQTKPVSEDLPPSKLPARTQCRDHRHRSTAHVWSTDVLYQEPVKLQPGESGSSELPAATAFLRLPPREARF